jgi:tetratricopeptide (TPR) repeat protein
MRLSIVVAGLLAAGIASAGNATSENRNGYVQIAKGDYVAAERVLMSERRIFPNDPDLLLNLALVYRHTGRVEAARSLYQRVLTAPDQELDLPHGGIGSAHALASAALRELAGQSTLS